MAETTWPALLTGLVQGRDQTREATGWAMEQILTGSATAAQLAAFVVALRAKGETATEVTGLLEVMLEFATPIEVGGHCVDVVGTGGDRSNTVNISTMAAVVAAASGARVVKHGNRAASSACGAADVLEALGVAIDLPPERQQRVVDEVGIGFLFAPLYHPALRHAAVPRRELGIPTTFNLLGPLANPAAPVAQAVGVADPRMAALMAEVFAHRGNQGLVVHGDDGLDELTTTTTSTVWLYANGRVSQTELDPRQLGLARGEVSQLTGGSAADNAAVARDILAGRPGPVHDIVALNAAAALLAYDGPALPEDPAAASAEDLVEQLRPRLARVQETIASGAALRTLDAWVRVSQAAAAPPNT